MPIGTSTITAPKPPQTLRSIASLPLSSTFSSSLPGEKWPASSPLARQSRPIKNAFWSYVNPERSPEHVLVAVSGSAARELDLEVPKTQEERRVWSGYLSGDVVFKDAKPYAQNYGGTQFGMWAGQLGDGRAVTLGDTLNSRGDRWELNLKGAGRTPYSRVFDGLAVLRSSIREFLGSELLHIMLAPLVSPSPSASSTSVTPTSRSLSLTLTRKPVYREDGVQPSAVVCRLAPGAGCVRVGTFELPFIRKEHDQVKKLADHVLAHFPHIATPSESDVVRAADIGGNGVDSVVPNVYGRLLREVMVRNAEMVAGWQAVGFVHGVMNTDNTSLQGVTIDFGPYGFLEDYDPLYVSNSEDHDHRYAFSRQPDAILWNLARLGRCLLDVVDYETPPGDLVVEEGMTDDEKSKAELERQKEKIERAARVVGGILSDFKTVYRKKYEEYMGKKLGLPPTADKGAVLDPLLALLTATRADYSTLFRNLCYFYVTPPAHKEGSGNVKMFTGEDVVEYFVSAWKDAEKRGVLVEVEGENVTEDWVRTHATSWVQLYRLALSPTVDSDSEFLRLGTMRATNPLRVPKGWILEDVAETCSRSPWASIRWDTSTTKEEEEAKEDQNVLLDMPHDGVIDEQSYTAAHGATPLPVTTPEGDKEFMVVQRALKVLGGDMFGAVSEDGKDEGWTEVEWEAAGRWTGRGPERRRNFACSCSS